MVLPVKVCLAMCGMPQASLPLRDPTAQWCRSQGIIGRSLTGHYKLRHLRPGRGEKMFTNQPKP